MKPRTLAVIAIVLAVLAVTCTVVGRRMHGQIREQLAAMDAELRQGISPEPTQREARTADMNALRERIDTAGRFSTIGYVASLLAIVTFAYRSRVVNRFRSESASESPQDGVQAKPS